MRATDWTRQGARDYARNMIGNTYRDHPLRQELQDQIFSNRELLTFLTNNSQDGLWYGDPDNPDNQWVSPKFLEVLGYSPGEHSMPPPSWDALLHPDDLATAIEKLHRQLQDPDTPVKMTLRFHHADGNTRWMLTRALVVRNSQGKPFRMLGVHTDITEQKQTEQALIQSNEKLSQFAHNLSHELRQPLATTTMLLDQLHSHMAPGLDSDNRALLDDARQTLERMTLQMVKLLALSEQARALDIQPVDTAQLVEEVLTDLREQVQRCHANVQLHDAPRVEGDPALLRLLFKNLITNAIKYQRPEAQPVIDIRARDRGRHWEFAVSDNGLGIDEQYHRFIFEQFARAPTGGAYEGDGLGLKLCTDAVEQHQGHIWLDSKLGRGSTFYFTLSKQLNAEGVSKH